MSDKTPSEESILLISMEKLEKMTKKHKESQKFKAKSDKTEEGAVLDLQHVEFQRNFTLNRWLNSDKKDSVVIQKRASCSIQDKYNASTDSQLTRLE